MKKILSILCSLFIFISCFGVNVYAKTEIPIAMCLNDSYTLPTIVAMTSMLENVKDETVYKYYLLLPGDFKEENKQKILSLKEKYSSKQFDIKFIDMKNVYANDRTGRFSQVSLYRLSLPNLLKEHDKCIYLDGDIIVEKDLSEFWSVYLEDYYVAGVRSTHMSQRIEYAHVLGIDDMTKYIYSGALLMNLKKLRDDKMNAKFEWFIENKVNKCRDILFPDQDTINACCYGKIKLLPLKYHYVNFDIMRLLRTESRGELYKFYGDYQIKEAINNHIVVHFAGPEKPWKNPNVLFAEKWWEYAMKTGFYDKIPKALEMKKKILEIRDKQGASKPIPDGIYTISSKLDPNKCLDISGSSKNDKANVHLWQRNGANNQKFKIEYNPDGSYTIRAMCSGKPINVAASGNKNGTNIWQYTNNGTDAQKWFIVPDGEGYYCLVSKCNNLCMDDSSAKAKNGANIHCWSIHGGDNQRFKLEKCEDKPNSNNPADLKKSA